MPASDPSQDTRVIPGQNENGEGIFSVLAKRTYDMAPSGLDRADQVLPLHPIDVYYEPGDPEQATVLHETDLVPFKPRTDFVVIAKAHAPNGRPAHEVLTSVRVGNAWKDVLVIGDRKAEFVGARRDPRFSDPEEFSQMEMRYDLAYGGVDMMSEPGVTHFYPRNPMGQGFVLQNRADTIDGLPLPNLEDPEDRLTERRLIVGGAFDWNAAPLPAGIGWFQKNWYPRCSFAGTIPGFIDLHQELREEAMGLVPRGQARLAREMKLPAFDTRFLNGASRGLMLANPSGRETVELHNLCEQGHMKFDLPGDSVSMALDIGAGLNPLDTAIQTITVRPDDRQVDIIWRGSLVYPGKRWLSNMKRLHSEVST